MFVQILIDLFGGVGTSALFNPICDRHDLCYETPGRSKSDCDLATQSDLLSLCAQYYMQGTSQLCEDYNSYRLTQCSTVANDVYKAVR